MQIGAIVSYEIKWGREEEGGRVKKFFLLQIFFFFFWRLNNHEREGEKKKAFQCRNTAISSLEVKPVSKKNVFLGTFSFFWYFSVPEMRWGSGNLCCRIKSVLTILHWTEEQKSGCIVFLSAYCVSLVIFLLLLGLETTQGHQRLPQRRSICHKFCYNERGRLPHVLLAKHYFLKHFSRFIVKKTQ